MYFKMMQITSELRFGRCRGQAREGVVVEWIQIIEKMVRDFWYNAWLELNLQLVFGRWTQWFF